jgi:hypothetical protein
VPQAHGTDPRKVRQRSSYTSGVAATTPYAWIYTLDGPQIEGLTLNAGKDLSQALEQNVLSKRWEMPTQAQTDRAQRMFDELGIKNITVKVVKDFDNE